MVRSPAVLIVAMSFMLFFILPDQVFFFYIAKEQSPIFTGGLLCIVGLSTFIMDLVYRKKAMYGFFELSSSTMFIFFPTWSIGLVFIGFGLWVVAWGNFHSTISHTAYWMFGSAVVIALIYKVIQRFKGDE